MDELTWFEQAMEDVRADMFDAAEEMFAAEELLDRLEELR